jgi:hypothetical protein
MKIFMAKIGRNLNCLKVIGLFSDPDKAWQCIKNRANLEYRSDYLPSKHPGPSGFFEANNWFYVDGFFEDREGHMVNFEIAECELDHFPHKRETK